MNEQLVESITRQIKAFDRHKVWLLEGLISSVPATLLEDDGAFKAFRTYGIACRHGSKGPSYTQIAECLVWIPMGHVANRDKLLQEVFTDLLVTARQEKAVTAALAKL
jgi:hypothetical protein